MLPFSNILQPRVDILDLFRSGYPHFPLHTHHAGVPSPVAMLRGVEPRSTERQSAIICRYTIASFNLHKAQKKIYTESNRSFCLTDKRSTNELKIFFKRNIAVCAFGTEDGT